MESRIKSLLIDKRISAINALIEITVKEYLEFARDITDRNEFQRRKVIRSRIKEILRNDLLHECLIPSIVLAVTDKEYESLGLEEIENSADKILTKALEDKNLLIIDGLQRTFVLLALEDDLKSSGQSKKLENLYSLKFRIEVYLGLNRTGLLYRMITLNTGQTTMSSRHLMEILYLDYSKKPINGISLIKDKDDTQIAANTSEFSFKTVLDGFNSYVEADEMLMSKDDILENVKTLNIFEKISYKEIVFENFLKSYKLLLDILILYSENWTFQAGGDVKLNSNPFGENALEIFKKSQALTGLGAALGKLQQKEVSLEKIEKTYSQITTPKNDWHKAYNTLIRDLDGIKDRSKKIGNDQRTFFKLLFINLLSPDSDSYLQFETSIEMANDQMIQLLNSKK